MFFIPRCVSPVLRRARVASQARAQLFSQDNLFAPHPALLWRHPHAQERTAPVTALEITATIVGIVGGGGGIIAWVKLASDLRKERRTEERADDALFWDSKKALRVEADNMAKAIWEQLGSDLEEARDELRSARQTIESQQSEIRELLQRLDVADRALLDAERKLAVAQAEIDRKERVVLQLQEQVSALEATVTELRKQLAECAGATGASSD